jgi:hypothetical protein
MKFVQAVVDGELVVANAPDEELLAGLTALELPPLSGGEGLRGFEYLLKMRIDRIKASAVAELAAELATARAERKALKATTPQQLWLTDLEEFSTAWDAYVTWRDELNAMTAAEAEADAKKKTKKPKAKALPTATKKTTKKTTKTTA